MRSYRVVCAVLSASTIRIFSDLHYGDGASRLKALSILRPLCDDADQIVLNGDTLDTRPSRDPVGSAAQRAEVLAYFEGLGRPVTFINGNHDPDLSAHHHLELADQRVFVTHGDILFEDVVPWSRDAGELRRLVAEGLAALSPAQRESLAEQFNVIHRAAARIPQRHQSERHGLKYAIGFAADTVWPPTRILRVLRARCESPERAARLLGAHRLPAKFFVMGHTHKLGVRRGPGGLIVLNTGSFCVPSRSGVVDVTADTIKLRLVERSGNLLRLGRLLAEFPLAAA